MSLTLKPSGLGAADDYTVLDSARRTIGRIMKSRTAPAGAEWFWTVTAHIPQPTSSRGEAPTFEAAKAAFKKAWDPMPVDDAEAMMAWAQRNIQGE